MKRFVLIIMLFFSVILQTSVIPHFKLLNSTINIIFIIVVCFCLFRNYLEASIWTVFGGILLDLFSVKSFGLSSISLMAVVIILFFLSEKFEIAKIYSRIWLGSISALIYYTAIIIFSYLFDLMKLSDNLLYLNKDLLIKIATGVVLNTLFIVLLYPVVELLNKWLMHVERKLETKFL